MKKVLFISSGGGHLCELLQLSDLLESYNSIVITEKEETSVNMLRELNTKCFFLLSARRNNLMIFCFKNMVNILLSFYYFIKIRPDIIITTGANTAVPMCYIGKLWHKKIVFIESYAVTSTRTLSGKLVYPIADLFLIQWESLHNLYPKSTYKGGLF